MTIYLKLFLTFLKIGAISFGGGYAMIPLIKDEVLSNNWLTEEELLNMIAVSESTPGPIAINMATFIGSTQGGILGSLLSTIGVVLPAFVIILMISMFIKNILKCKSVKATLNSIKPAFMALIISTGTTMFLSIILNISNINSTFNLDIISIIIFALICITAILFKKWKKKKISPILLIILSGILGIIGYGIF